MHIEEIQSFCKSLPAVTESIKWEDHLCFCIGEKMFAVTSLAGKDTISFKVTPDIFDKLVEQPPFVPAPYLARYKWVFMEDFKLINDGDLKTYIRQSYELVRKKLPKGLQKKIEEASP